MKSDQSASVSALPFEVLLRAFGPRWSPDVWLRANTCKGEDTGGEGVGMPPTPIRPPPIWPWGP